MSKSANHTDLLSHQIDDILAKPPSWIFRCGSGLLFVIVGFFIAIAAFLKYPTIISGKLKLTTRDLPVKVVSKVPGRVEKLFVTEQAMVSPGERLAAIESPLSSESISFLKTVVSKTSRFLSDEKGGVDFLATSLAFGYLQAEFNSLTKKMEEYQFFKTNRYNHSKVKDLKEQIAHLNKLAKIAERKLQLNRSLLANSEEKFYVDKKLLDAQVVSRLEYIKAENDFIRQQQENQDLQKEIEELHISSLEYRRLLTDFVFEIEKQELDYKQSIKQSLKILESAVVNWDQNYVVESAIQGTVFVLNNLTTNQHVRLNDPLFLIVPAVQKFVCMVDIPSRGYGRVKNGQKVRIKLDNYPSHEFGLLNGKVIHVPEIPIEASSDSNVLYRVVVEVDPKQRSNYNKILQFKPEMTGIGEVITDEQSFLRRVIYKMRGLN